MAMTTTQPLTPTSNSSISMATTQPLTPSTSNSSISGRRGCVKTECVNNNDSFPAGLRVLVVDDDPICLLILDRMLRRCLYEVTTCGKATDALEMLRGNRESFDLVISDVYMPDMDGFKLLEHVGLEMDLPVIMMSANGETSAVMKGIKHGACDYLLKPVRMEELRNIWQHVVRRKWRVSRQSTSHEDDKCRRGGDDSDYTSSLVNEGFDGSWKQPKKRKDVKEEEDDPDQDNDDSSTTKKPRVVWSVDLHQQFVNAVNQLGIDKAVPKRILELMNVQGLTRENVASHLQKYRLYLKRISGVAHQQGGLNPPFPGSTDSGFGPIGASGLGGLGDLRTLAGSGQLSPQALMSTLQAGLLGRLGQPNNLQLGSVDPSLLLQIAALGANNSPLGRPSFGQSIQGNYQAAPADIKQLQTSQQLGAFAGSLDKGTGGIALQPPSQQQQQHLSTAGNLGGMGQLVGINNNIQKIGSNNNALLMQAIQQQVGVSQLKGPGGLTLPTGGVSGQPGVLSDIGAWSSPISSMNASTMTGSGVMSQSSPLMQGPSSPLVPTGSSSSLLGSLARAGADNKNLHSSSSAGINISIPSPVNTTSPLGSVGLDDSARLRTVGSLGAVSENIPQSFSSYAPKFTSVSGGAPHGQGFQRNQVAWQGYGLNQELSQVNNPVLSPRYSQVSSSHCLSLGGGQEPGQPRAGFGTGFPSNFSVDSLKPSVTATSSRSEQSTADSDLKMREGLMLEAKQEQTWLSEPLSDELLNIVLKQQQQEGLEVGLATPDNYSLDNT